MPAGSGSLRSFREPRRSSEILINPPGINEILSKSFRSSLRAGSETRRSLLGSSAGHEVPKPRKPTKNHHEPTLNGERSTEPTSNHFETLFCTTLEWFQAVWRALVSPIGTQHDFLDKNHGNPSVLHPAGLLPSTAAKCQNS